MQALAYSRRALCCVMLLAPVHGFAESKPLWELGLGPGVVEFSDYPGSAAYRTWLLPVPYVRYRGKFLRSDRDGVRGVFVDAPRVSMNVSLGATVPAHSRGNSARAGMPSLNALLEIGPSVDLHLWHSDAHNMQLDLRMPVRAALTFNFPPRGVGWIAAPHLNLDIRALGGPAGWDLGILAGPLYASQRYNQYFYAVDPGYVTPQRPAYDPPAGYAGAECTMALSRRFRTFWVGGFVRYQNLDGAVFIDSPLIRSHYDLAGGIGIAWIVGHSSRDVEAAE